MVDEALVAVKPEETKAADAAVDTKEKEAVEDQRPVSRDDSDKDEVRYLHLHEIQHVCCRSKGRTTATPC